MGNTHSRHSGSGALAPDWLLPVRLEADELLSSWIIRAAHKQDASIFRFISFYGAGAFFRDVDMSVPDDMLIQLAKASGISISALRMAMLEPHISRMLDGAASTSTINNWVLPIGLQPIKRVSGVQFCPLCWQSDSDPYLRINWRLAWQVVCPAHGSLLLDRCSQCGAIISPHFSRPFRSTMACCTQCMCDLSASPTEVIPERVLAYQARCDQVLHDGHGEAMGRPWPASQWFLLQLVYVSALLRLNRKKPGVLVALLGRSLGKEQHTSSGLRIELMRTSERAGLIELLERVQRLSPSDTIEFARLSGRAPKSLLNRLRQHHDLISELGINVTETIPRKRATGPRSKSAVQAMMNALRMKAKR